MRHLRRPLTLLAATATCGSLVLAAGWALTPSLFADASQKPPAASRAVIASAQRSWRVTLSPLPDDLALAQISFHGSHARQIARGSLQVALSGPFGDDYMAAGAIRTRTPGGPQALVLLVNRPSPLLDPVSVVVALTAGRSLGTPVVHKLADPFTHPEAGSTPALCDLRKHGSALGASEISTLDSHGSSLAGFSAASAVAQAYDVVCGLPYVSSFEQAIRAPSAAPPVGKIPGEGCEPEAGRACPMTAGGTVSTAAIAGVGRATGAAH
jgi:hypothetical protein